MTVCSPQHANPKHCLPGKRKERGGLVWVGAKEEREYLWGRNLGSNKQKHQNHTLYVSGETSAQSEQ